MRSANYTLYDISYHMRRLFIFLFLIQAVVLGFSQSEKNYHQRALEIQHEIWDDTSAAFKVTQIPEGMKHESGVILATSYEINDKSSPTFKIILRAQKLNLHVTERYRVKLNDHRAIARYSNIEYLKNYNETHIRLYDIYRNISDTYIGVKIIHADGTETVVKTDEDVLKRNGKESDSLYIPGLLEGDIIDFYSRVEKIVDVSQAAIAEPPYTFQLGNKYFPTLYERLKFQFGEYFRAQYICANGAPPLVRSRDGNGNTTLELTLTDLPRFRDTFWISEMRQIPCISFDLAFIDNAEVSAGQFAGEIKPGSLYSKYTERATYYLSRPIRFDNQPLKITKDYFGGREKMERIPRDSVVKVLFNAWYYVFFNTKMKDSGSYANNVKYSSAKKLEGAFEMSKMLASIGIDNTLYLVCSRNAASFKNIINMLEMDALIFVRADSVHSYWMAFDDILTLFNEVPARFQGEFAFGIQNNPKSKSLENKPENYKLPFTTSDDNTIRDSILVNFDSANPRLLRIELDSRATGAPRHHLQRQLMLFDDIDAALSSSVSQKTILTKLESDQGKKVEVEDQKKNFNESIHSRFGSFARELLNYEVINPLLCRSENSFSYRTVFTMGNWVTNDNSQLILRAGKLLGDYQDIAKPDHIRTMNVYLPDARKFDVVIRVNIPVGYHVKNVDDLNISVNNETGSCKSNATVTGQVITWHVSETFLNNFEPASNWPKLTEILNAIYNLSEKKISIEKN